MVGFVMKYAPPMYNMYAILFYSINETNIDMYRRQRVLRSSANVRLK